MFRPGDVVRFKNDVSFQVWNVIAVQGNRVLVERRGWTQWVPAYMLVHAR